MVTSTVVGCQKHLQQAAKLTAIIKSRKCNNQPAMQQHIGNRNGGCIGNSAVFFASSTSGDS